MFDNFVTNESAKIFLAIVLFPLLFQDSLLTFVWGADDIFWLATAKRLFLLLPALGFIFCCYAMMFSLLTVPFRAQRSDYIRLIVLSWWDYCRALFSFWGGIGKFVFCLFGWIFSLLRIVFWGTWLSFQDVALAPLRVGGDVYSNYFRPGLPWVALSLLIGWSLLEALIFTIFVSPLVIDVIAGTTGGTYEEHFIRIPLFIVLFVFVLGSYSLVEVLARAIDKGKIGQIIIIFMFEIFAAGFEVVFLYREFVDALVPWFAQHAGDDFQLGIVGLLAIATFAWLGIRGLTWFLFGSSGAPAVIAIVQRSSMAGAKPPMPTQKAMDAAKLNKLEYITTAIANLKNDLDWLHRTGDEIISAFALPPLQIVASCVNFFTLIINGKHVFKLPFTNIQDIFVARNFLHDDDQQDKAS